ncbi:hypothetical protein C8R46DRAFT_1322683 [Mycena filopes]|nr:hypothetical protein C8R46DRAFT_1322683 [Mycena filopes]
MARTKGPRAYTVAELGESNPLDNDEIPNAGRVILKVTLSTSARTLSLSTPDPFFRLFADVEIFHSPRPESAITISTGGSALDNALAITLGAFHLESMTSPVGKGPLLLTDKARLKFRRRDFKNKDLLRDPEFRFGFITVPAYGSARVELPLSLERILQGTTDGNVEDLKAGMTYRVWMKNDMLSKVGEYVYWGDLASDLKEKKLSNYQALEGNQPEASSSGYLAEVIAGDGWALRALIGTLEKRGNVGRFGPVIEFVE